MNWQRSGLVKSILKYPKTLFNPKIHICSFDQILNLKRSAHSASTALPCVTTLRKKKATKQLKTAQDNLKHKEILASIQDEHKIFKKGVKRVIDLGCAPGNWMVLCRSLIRRYNRYNTKEFTENCLILGIDVLFVQSNRGISMLQGNILSKDLLQRAKAHLKEVAYKQANKVQGLQNVKEITKDSLSSTANLLGTIRKIPEITQSTTEFTPLHKNLQVSDNGSLLAEESVEKSYFLEEAFESLAVEASHRVDFDYKVDLILSDLGPVIYFQPDFWNNTSTRPYARFAMSESLRQTVYNNNKGCIDTADAALVYCCELLRPGGSFVLRLPLVWREDPELSLLETRLGKMFQTVVRQDGDVLKIEKHTGDIIYICKQMNDGLTKTEVFGV